MTEERKAQLDELAELGALLGITDAQTLLDLEQVQALPMPFTDPEQEDSCFFCSKPECKNECL